jgi:hypothetical protein
MKLSYKLKTKKEIENKKYKKKNIRKKKEINEV